MRDSQYGGQGDRVHGGLAALARNVVAQLAARDAWGERQLDDATVVSIARALLDSDPSRLDDLRQDLRRVRISDIDLVDSYFPEVARYIGCAWVDDSAAFAEVTLVVSKMQAILRDVGRDWTSGDGGGGCDAATVLVVLPEGEQHSFGAMVLSGQLRRRGISVRLEIGTTADGLGRLARERSFDCAMISVACEEKLDPCRRLVEALKQGSDGRLTVAVGGALLDRPIDILRLTGADVVTRDPMMALLKARDRASAGLTKVIEAID
jgi:methanogenic corrinoid protein MtbC1